MARTTTGRSSGSCSSQKSAIRRMSVWVRFDQRTLSTLFGPGDDLVHIRSHLVVGEPFNLAPELGCLEIRDDALVLDFLEFLQAIVEMLQLFDVNDRGHWP